MVKCRLFFDNGTESIHNISEETLIKQMSKPQHKRNYTYGVEFSYVHKVEVIELV